MNQLKNGKYKTETVAVNISWSIIEKFTSLLISLIVNIILARILNPADFGLLAVVEVFITLTRDLVVSGFPNALLQKKNSNSLFFSTAFWSNLFLSIILYFVLFLFAPSIAILYNMPQLNAILRVLGLSLIFSALYSIQGAYVGKNMAFKQYFFSTLFGKLFSGLIGITLALKGLGVWSLVAQLLSLVIIECFVLWIRVDWKPEFKFSWQCATDLWHFAWKIILTNFIVQSSEQIRKLVVGKKYKAEELAYYSKGSLLPASIIINITTSLNAVMFPVLSDAQDDSNKSLKLCRRWVELFAYCALPLLTVIALSANEIIVGFLTNKWILAAPYLRFACAYYSARIIEVPIRESLKANGYANITLRMQIIKSFISLVALFIFMNNGVFAIAAAGAACSIFNIVISSYYGNKYLNYNQRMLLKDIWPSLRISIVIGLPIFALSFFSISPLVLLISKIITFIIVYVCASKITCNKQYMYMVELIRTVIRSRH